MRIFDGKKFAEKIEKDLIKKVGKLKTKPKLVAILVGKNPASILYTNLKKKVSERIGIEFEILNFPPSIQPIQLTKVIKDLNEDKTVNGIMIQLPLPPNLKPKLQFILNHIEKSKDVDGLTKNSLYMPATTKAVIKILHEAIKITKNKIEKIAVVGSNGVVGKSVVRELKNLKFNVVGVDIETRNLKSKLENADVIISATGKHNLIKESMIKQNAIVIDVGAPKGDVRFNEVSKKVLFITPVPGGVGPVTIISLLDNLLIAANND